MKKLMIVVFILASTCTSAHAGIWSFGHLLGWW